MVFAGATSLSLGTVVQGDSRGAAWPRAALTSLSVVDSLGVGLSTV